MDANLANAVGSGSDRPVDLVHLGAMTQGDSALEREVLAIFLSQAPIYVARVRKAGDALARRRAAHSLKGAARGIGAWRLARCAEAAEQGGSEAALIEETDRVCAYIRRLD